MNKKAVKKTTSDILKIWKKDKLSLSKIRVYPGFHTVTVECRFAENKMARLPDIDLMDKKAIMLEIVKRLRLVKKRKMLGDDIICNAVYAPPGRKKAVLIK